MTAVVIAMVFCLALMSCAKRVPVGVQVDRPAYSYRRVSDTAFRVFAVNRAGLTDAMKEIGCAPPVVCTVEPNGNVFTVQQVAK